MVNLGVNLVFTKGVQQIQILLLLNNAMWQNFKTEYHV